MAAPMIPQGKLVPLFKKTIGLDLGNPPTQLEANEAESIVPLASCSNMDVLRNGTLIRRDGEELLFDVLHARYLWAEGEFCFFIAQDEMYQILPNFEKKLVRHSLSLGLPMYFCRVGTRVYYSNTVDSGYIQSSTDYPWDVTPYRGPATDRIFSEPKRGKFLRLYQGRIYMAEDNILWFTEYMDYHKMDLARNYITFSSRITGIAPTEDCLWVTTESEIVAILGEYANGFRQGQMAEFGGGEGTLARVPPGKTSRLGTWWFVNTQNGVCMLGPGGQFVNATWPRFALPCTKGVAMVTGDKYVCTFS